MVGDVQVLQIVPLVPIVQGVGIAVREVLVAFAVEALQEEIFILIRQKLKKQIRKAHHTNSQILKTRRKALP